MSVEASDAALGAPRNWRGAALLGLAKVAMREASRLSVAALDIGACGLRSPEATARAILAEPAQRLPRPDAVPDDVALRGGLRLTRALEEVALGPVPSGGDGSVRRRGVYLLTGGAGGIGAALARRLAAAHSARLVLVGRAAPDARHAALCAELVALGGEAVYEAADCADPSAMAGLRDRTLARFGVVHGVFHAAFILADRTLSGMSGSELGAALRPKLDGTQAVIEAFSGLPLDFLALFSSTNAFTANAGQANYVAASMAQDAAGAWFFAQGIPIRTVNWGFWGEVGRVSTGFHRERLRRSGGGMIGTEEGLDALLSVLGAGVPSVSVLKLKAPQRAVPQNRSGASLPDVLLEVVPNLRIAASGMAELFTELADGMQALEAWGRRVLRDTLPRSLAHATETRGWRAVALPHGRRAERFGERCRRCPARRATGNGRAPRPLHPAAGRLPRRPARHRRRPPVGERGAVPGRIDRVGRRRVPRYVDGRGPQSLDRRGGRRFGRCHRSPSVAGRGGVDP